jgi:hypothetical protein
MPGTAPGPPSHLAQLNAIRSCSFVQCSPIDIGRSLQHGRNMSLETTTNQSDGNRGADMKSDTHLATVQTNHSRGRLPVRQPRAPNTLTDDRQTNLLKIDFRRKTLRYGRYDTDTIRIRIKLDTDIRYDTGFFRTRIFVSIPYLGAVPSVSYIILETAIAAYPWT